jgi:hypothetical protein
VKEVGENGAWYETKTEEGLLEGIFFPSSLQNTEEVIRKGEKRKGNNRRREYG